VQLGVAGSGGKRPYQRNGGIAPGARAGQPVAGSTLSVLRASSWPTMPTRLLMGCIDCNLLHVFRSFHLTSEEVRRSRGWIIKRLIKVGAKAAHHGRRRHAHGASVFPPARHYETVFG